MHEHRASLDNVRAAVYQSDFVLVIWGPVDHIERQSGESVLGARDNTVMELGLAVGVLGSARTFLVSPVPSTARKPRVYPFPATSTRVIQYSVPSNYDGIQITNVPDVASKRCDAKSAKMRAAVRHIKSEITRLGPATRSLTMQDIDCLAAAEPKAFANEMLARSLSAVEALRAPGLPKEGPESDFYHALSRQVGDDRIYAVCGDKNWYDSSVAAYMKANECAALDRGVKVVRLYAAADQLFSRRELITLNRHLELGNRIPDRFLVGALLGPKDTRVLNSLALPDRFGLVLLRQRMVWTAYLHYGTSRFGNHMHWQILNPALFAYLHSVFQEARVHAFTPVVRESALRRLRTLMLRKRISPRF
jgi:hypothetical protein